MFNRVLSDTNFIPSKDQKSNTCDKQIQNPQHNTTDNQFNICFPSQPMQIPEKPPKIVSNKNVYGMFSKPKLSYNENKKQVHQPGKFQCLKYLYKYFINFKSSYQQQQIQQIQPNQKTQNNSQIKQEQNSSQMLIEDSLLMKQVKQKQQCSLINVSIKAQRTLLKCNSRTDIPAMITVQTLKGGDIVSADIIFLIDTSGSMEGQKLQFVKQTINYLMDILNDSVRICLISFNTNAKVLAGFKNLTKQNIQKIKEIVSDIKSQGQTYILKGLNLALQTLTNRKSASQVTSILLLSDGRQSSNNYIVKDFQNGLQNKNNQKIGPFTIHTFGFGNDHDQDLMINLSQVKNGGSFYYVKEIQTLDQAFSNVLGSVVSVVATAVQIRLKQLRKGLASGIKIKKTFNNMWKKQKNGEYLIKLQHLSSQLTKNFVFQLQVPSIKGSVLDLQRENGIIEVQLTGLGMNGQKISKKCKLVITLLNQNEKIVHGVQNQDVIENYLRVRTAETIAQSTKKADQNKYEQAKINIDKMIKIIRQSRKVKKQKLQMLIKDLQKIKKKCDKVEWKIDGRKISKDSQQTLSLQVGFQFLNKTQINMMQQMSMKKIEKSSCPNFK